MTAPQPLNVVTSPQSRRLYPPRQRRLSRRSAYLAAQSPLALGLEVGAKLAVNLLLLAAIVSALMKLVPYFQNQRARLQAVDTAVKQAETETAELRTDFSRYFDPSQASSIMQEQSGRKSPLQRTVVWTEPDYNP
ncbi:slr1601 family putative cell division protein [Almyronema epifaneia]|uniref:Cell division protein FtsL n=1 Tax=Almyronema epifaneia S1 TaxID=2991925 RepID=A0ABW6ICX4_9CYAN